MPHICIYILNHHILFLVTSIVFITLNARFVGFTYSMIDLLMFSVNLLSLINFFCAILSLICFGMLVRILSTKISITYGSAILSFILLTRFTCVTLYIILILFIYLSLLLPTFYSIITLPRPYPFLSKSINFLFSALFHATLYSNQN